jgi:hypothetical protein
MLFVTAAALAPRPMTRTPDPACSGGSSYTCTLSLHITVQTIPLELGLCRCLPPKWCLPAMQQHEAGCFWALVWHRLAFNWTDANNKYRYTRHPCTRRLRWTPLPSNGPEPARRFSTDTQAHTGREHWDTSTQCYRVRQMPLLPRAAEQPSYMCVHSAFGTNLHLLNKTALRSTCPTQLITDVTMCRTPVVQLAEHLILNMLSTTRGCFAAGTSRMAQLLHAMCILTHGLGGASVGFRSIRMPIVQPLAK